MGFNPLCYIFYLLNHETSSGNRSVARSLALIDLKESMISGLSSRVLPVTNAVILRSYSSTMFFKVDK